MEDAYRFDPSLIPHHAPLRSALKWGLLDFDKNFVLFALTCLLKYIGLCGDENRVATLSVIAHNSTSCNSSSVSKQRLAISRMNV